MSFAPRLSRSLARAVVLLAAAAAFSTSMACSTRAGQGRTIALDPDVDDNLGGTGIESGDIRGAADRIARALSVQLRTSRGRVAVAPVLNRTRFRIDPALVQNHLVHDLQKNSRGRFSLVAMKSATATTTANAVLRTELRSLTKDNGQTTSDYVEYFFALEDPNDGTVLWSGLYETKRASDVDVIYQ